MDVTRLQRGIGVYEDRGTSLQTEQLTAIQPRGQGRSNRSYGGSAYTGQEAVDYIDIEASTVTVLPQGEDNAQSGQYTLAPLPQRQVTTPTKATVSGEFSSTTPLNYSISRRNGGAIEVQYDTMSRGQLLNFVA